MPFYASALLYMALTALLLHNLIPVITTHLLSDLGDPLIDTSILAWNALHVPLSQTWWNFPAFAPLQGVTAFTEHFLLVYPLTSPIIWLTGNAVLAYNVVFLLLWPVNAAAAWALTFELTGSRQAAFVGGLAFGFAPYLAVQISHPQMLVIFGMPLSLFGLHRYLRTRRWTDAAIFAGGWLAAALASAYTLVFFPLLVLLWCVWFVRPREWRVLIVPIAASALASIPLVPLLAGYSTRQAAFGLARSYGEARSYGADVAGLLGISHRHWLWSGWLPTTYGEGAVFPGFTIAALAVVAMVMCRPRGTARRALRAAPRLRRVSAWCVTFAFLVTAIVLLRVWTGPDGWHIASVALPPFRPYRLFTFAVIFFIAAVLTGERFRSTWRLRDVATFYAVAAVSFWLLALGPEPTWTQERIITYGPYRLFFELHIPAIVRVSARAWTIVLPCLAALAAFGTAALVNAARSRQRMAFAAIAMLVIAEAWFVDVTQKVPLPMPPGLIPTGAVVLDVPFGDPFVNAAAQYRGVIGGYRTVNGYSGYEPPQFANLVEAFEKMQFDAIDGYRRGDDLYVIVRREANPAFARWMASRNVSPSEAGDALVYRLPALP